MTLSSLWWTCRWPERQGGGYLAACQQGQCLSELLMLPAGKGSECRAKTDVGGSRGSGLVTVPMHFCSPCCSRAADVLHFFFWVTKPGVEPQVQHVFACRKLRDPCRNLGKMHLARGQRCMAHATNVLLQVGKCLESVASTCSWLAVCIQGCLCV